MGSFLDQSFYGNAVETWLLAAGTAVLVYLGLVIFRRLVLRHFRALAERTVTDVDDIIAATLDRTTVLFLLFLALYAGSRVLVFPGGGPDTDPPLERALKFIGIVVVTLQTAIWGSTLITAAVKRETQRRLADDPAGATTLNALGFLGRLALWTILVLLALQNAGIQIGPLLAGLGVGGIAVALALQNVLGDLLASLSIVLDKPFVLGDFVIVGEQLGTVEKIGLKSTRVRSLSGEQLVFSNNDMLNSRIRNFKRMFERRIVFSLGVIYQTPRATVERIPGIIREAVEGQEDVRFDRAHFQKFGGSSLDFEAVFYVLSPDYNVYMDRQQAINLHIMRRFDEDGIEFAYPTQTLFVEGGETALRVAQPAT